MTALKEGIKSLQRYLGKNKFTLTIGFMVMPLIITLIVFFVLEKIIFNDRVIVFITYLGFSFTLSSLIVVIILYDQYSHSEYIKDAKRHNYLEKEAIEELKRDLCTLLDNLNGNSNQDLSECCSNINYIYKILEDSKRDIILQAFKGDLKNIVHLLNKHKVKSENIKSLHGNIKDELIRDVFNLNKELDSH